MIIPIPSCLVGIILLPFRIVGEIAKSLLNVSNNSDNSNKSIEYPRTISNDDNKSIILKHAVINNNVNEVKILLEGGCDVNKIYYKDSNTFYTALIHASASGHTEIVQLLLKYGAIVDLVDNFGAPAISHAVTWGHTEIVKLLLEYGADPNTKDRTRLSLMAFAAMKGFQDIINLLIQYGSSDKVVGKGVTRNSMLVAMLNSHEKTENDGADDKTKQDILELLTEHDKEDEALAQKLKKDSMLLAKSNPHKYIQKNEVNNINKNDFKDGKPEPINSIRDDSDTKFFIWYGLISGIIIILVWIWSRFFIN